MSTRKTRSAMWGRSFVILGAFLVFAQCVAYAVPRKVSKDLETKNPNEQIDVIVQYNHTPTLRQHKNTLSHGGKLVRELGLVTAGVYHLPAAKLQELEANPDVAHVWPDRPVFGAALVSSTTPILDYHTNTANAPAAWAMGLDGSGIGVFAPQFGPRRGFFLGVSKKI